MTELGIFPFGAPVQPCGSVLPDPCDAVVLGAYPSAIHVRWVPPRASGLRPISALAVDNEPTVFWLTNHVRRVFATDQYLAGGWEESASQRMLTEPGSAWEGPWNPRRLVVQHMDALDLRYEDDSFDAVFSSSSIEHFGTHEDVARSIREAHRVLKPGGVLTVSTELRLDGPGPGLPGILLFSPDILRYRKHAVVRQLHSDQETAEVALQSTPSAFPRGSPQSSSACTHLHLLVAATRFASSPSLRHMCSSAVHLSGELGLFHRCRCT